MLVLFLQGGPGQWRPGTGQRPIRAVAVLPLHNVSVDPAESDYLADGLSEALITRLAQLPGLRVTPWMTAQRYKDHQDHEDSHRPLDELGRELGVDALVTGTLRKDGDRASVTLSLVDAGTGMQFWGEEFEDSLADILAMQRRIAVGAATILKGKLTGREEELVSRAASVSAEAYEYYLRGSAVGSGRSENDLAFALLQRALELDPRLAEAHIGLGDVKFWRYYFGWEGESRNLDEAEAYYRKALSLNPDLGRAYSGLVAVYSFQGRGTEAILALVHGSARSSRDDVERLVAEGEAYYTAGLWDKALSVFDRVIELDPANADAHANRVFTTVFLNDFESTTVAAEVGIRRGVANTRNHLWAGVAYHASGDLEQARRHYERALELGPDDFVVYAQLGVFYRQTGDPEQARRCWQSGVDVVRRMLAAYPKNPRVRSWLAILLGYMGDAEGVAIEEAAVLEAGADNASLLTDLARAHAALGDTVRAVQFLRQASAAGRFNFYWTRLLEPMGLEALAQSPEYRVVIEENERQLERLRRTY